MQRPLLFFSSLALFNQALAINPVDGFYSGFRAGGYYVAAINDIPLPTVAGVTVTPTTPTLNNKVGFTGAIQGGYRFKERYRVELSVFYNGYSPRNLKLDGVEIAPNDEFVLKGSEYNIGGMLNAYIDFFSHLGNEVSETVPYVGIGIGMASAHTELRFKSDDQEIVTNKDSKTVSAIQGIIGFNYWADDYTSIGVDYRLQKFGKISAFDNAPLAHNLSVTFNFAFDDVKEQLAS